MPERDSWDVILRPLVTEKSMRHAQRGVYTFQVRLDANKIEIRRAVEQAFDVDVVSVNTMRVRGKRRRLGRFREGRTAEWKKAIVRLATGQTIEELTNI